MTIEQKLTDKDIKKILVVDDREENTQAAKEYFQTIPIKTDYASSAQEAITKMKENYKAETKYDLIITDLEMETKNAGLDVVKEALNQTIYVTIATGMNYDQPEEHGHGPSTTIMPTKESIKGKKNNPEVWEQAMKITLDYIASPEIQRSYNSAKRYKKYTGKESELFKEIMLKLYK
ncbi:response regulator [Candidatus Woesearchaeota archaeon]|nr:response regulator [Candidatus Woesearchaeota archaeon]